MHRRCLPPLLLALAGAACADRAPPPQPEPDAPPARNAPAAGADTLHWRCGDLAVASHHLDHSGLMELSFSGRALVLPAAVSASGARYADDNGNAFWNHGGEAMLQLQGEPDRACARTDQPSPWYHAAARGVRYRAVGNEPGGLLELGGGDRPSLQAELDYGERRLQVPAMDPSADGWTGRGVDGSRVEVSVVRQSCSDPMSGERFESTAQLRVGETVYRGCGAFLDD
jgi:putative lipoprotein